MRCLMFVIAMVSAACAEDTASAEDFAEIKQELVDAADPDIKESQLNAIELIEHLHGKEEVEAYRQKLLDAKAVEIAQVLVEQEAAEKAAKAKAIEAADAKSAVLADKIEKAEAAQAKGE